MQWLRMRPLRGVVCFLRVRMWGEGERQWLVEGLRWLVVVQQWWRGERLL